METVKLSSKGQIVIPKELRDTHHWNTGTEFVVSATGTGILLIPSPAFPSTNVRQVAGILARKGSKRLSEDRTREAIGKSLKARDEATKS